MRLLVVDWDYFFPLVERPQDGSGNHWQLYDWGHREAPFFQDFIWSIRAVDFKRAGLALPAISGQEKAFWQRFQISPRATLYIADSNSYAFHGQVIRGITSLWLFDAHHDAGYRGSDSLRQIMERKTVTCDDWMLGYDLRGVELHMRYPAWRYYARELEPEPAIDLDRQIDTEAPIPLRFDKVFLCRSSVWVPSWLDQQFFKFVQACPVRKTINLDGMEPRSWDPAQVDALLEADTRARAQWAAQRGESDGS